jgi:aspartyl-tRNA(Asn)/glutamyl-tRNA(Gln) amidotransferase subunit C
MTQSEMELLDEAHVRQVALLARLELTDDEIAEYRGSLNSILGYVRALEKLDTSSVEPTSHALRLTNIFRSDVPKPSFTAEQATANAPESEDLCFRVPAVLQEEDS